jgi:hypothetical protein
MNLVISKCVTAVKSSNFSGRYLSKRIFLFLTTTLALILLFFFHVLLFLGPSVTINSVLLKGAANLSVGLTVHNVKVGQRLLGEVGHTYHLYGLLSRLNNGKNY